MLLKIIIYINKQKIKYRDNTIQVKNNLDRMSSSDYKKL